MVFGWGLVITKRGQGAHCRCPLPVLTLFCCPSRRPGCCCCCRVVVGGSRCWWGGVGGGDGGVGGGDGGDGGGGDGGGVGGCWVVWLRLRVVVVVVELVVDRCDAHIWRSFKLRRVSI